MRYAVDLLIRSTPLLENDATSPLPRTRIAIAMVVDPDGNLLRPDQDPSMTTEQNKPIAHEFFARFSASGLDGALAAHDVWIAPAAAVG